METFSKFNDRYEGTLTESDWTQHSAGGWVHRTAKVGGGAEVGEGAKVGAWAKVGEGAKVGAGAVLCEKTVWKKSPLFIIGSRHCIYNAKPGHLGIGCKIMPYAWWITEEARRFALDNGYTKTEIEEYSAYVEFFTKHGK